jgi:uncharacterized protein YcbX
MGRVRVEQLWRYPVKSIGGEALDAVELTPAGVPGDRAWAVWDEAAGEATWAGVLPPLMRVTARTREDRVTVRLPDGDLYPVDGPGLAAALTRLTGRAVRVVPHRNGEVAAPLHVLSTVDLAALAAALPGIAVDVSRFRPNLVLAPPDDAPPRSWLGRVLAVGSARLRITAGCVRCQMITMATPSVPLDRAVLRWVAQERANVFGAYAEVERAGAVRVGDPARWVG